MDAVASEHQSKIKYMSYNLWVFKKQKTRQSNITVLWYFNIVTLSFKTLFDRLFSCAEINNIHNLHTLCKFSKLLRDLLPADQEKLSFPFPSPKKLLNTTDVTNGKKTVLVLLLVLIKRWRVVSSLYPSLWSRQYLL